MKIFITQKQVPATVSLRSGLFLRSQGLAPHPRQGLFSLCTSPQDISVSQHIEMRLTRSFQDTESEGAETELQPISSTKAVTTLKQTFSNGCFQAVKREFLRSMKE